MKRLYTVFFALLLLTCVPAVHAQDATPGPKTCTVEPRTQAEIEAVNAGATAVATNPNEPASLPEGEPVDEATVAALLATLEEANACAAAGDLPRLFALYTDNFIVNRVFAGEDVVIVLATPPPGDEATPVPLPVERRPSIQDARRLADGRIAALVHPDQSGRDRQIVWFAQIDERWLIDDVRPAMIELATPVVIPAEAIAVVDLVLADAAMVFRIPVEQLAVSELETAEWPDAALGCPEEGGVYAEVVSPGYRILVTDGSQNLEYHTGLSDSFVLCES